MSYLTRQIKVKLKIYSEIIGKNKLEALHEALSIAKAVREKKIDLMKICVQIEKENEIMRNKRFFEEQKRKREIESYLKNKDEMDLRRKERKLRKVV
jgi:hypothetical protein